MLADLLSKVGLTAKQAQLFLIIYQYGSKPASTLAKMLGDERTNTYKALQVLIRMGLVAETNKQGIKQFYIPDKQVLRNRIMQQKSDIESQELLLPKIEAELVKFDEQHISPIPKMRFFEGKSGITQLFENILNTVRDKGLLVIKCFATNTIESQSQSQKTLAQTIPNFFSELKRAGIHIDIALGNGIYMLEDIFKSQDIVNLQDSPAGNSSAQIYVVGDSVYLIIFKSIPFGLKIESEELASIMHFFIKTM
jgi:sugar-specific transcriptional regulator TrmB